LRVAAEYHADDTTLKLYDKDGAELLAYAKEESTLTESWVVVGLNNGKEAVTGTIAGSELTAVFAEDGTLSGNAGVNTYRATYTTSDGTIEIGPVATTKMAGPQDLMDQEQQYPAALDRATTYTVRGDSLELRDDAGALQVGYTRGTE
jgi:heat shock protein HslJ